MANIFGNVISDSDGRDGSFNREVLQHVILAKKPYERRLRGATPILYVILLRKPRNERPRIQSLDVAHFFLTLVVLWLGVTLTFSIWARGWEAHTFLCLEEGAKPHPGYLGFTSSQSAAKCCKTKTWRSARWQITYVFWHVITSCKTSLESNVRETRSAIPRDQKVT